MTRAVVIDASLATMWAVPEPHSQQALALAGEWARAGSRLLAPGLLLAEVANALYKRILRRELDLGTATRALRVILGFAVEIREEPGLPARAIALAHQLRRPSTYDCHYLALAERFRCELWTGDHRFYHAVEAAIPWVKWIGHYRTDGP